MSKAAPTPATKPAPSTLKLWLLLGFLGLFTTTLVVCFAVLPGGLVLLGWDCLQDGICQVSYASRGLGAQHSVLHEGFAAYLLGLLFWAFAAVTSVGLVRTAADIVGSWPQGPPAWLTGLGAAGFIGLNTAIWFALL